MDVIPPVSLNFGSDVRLFAPGATHPAVVQVTAYRAGAAGTLRLDAPAGWTISPASQAFTLNAVGESAKFTFTVSAPQPDGVGGYHGAAWKSMGLEFDNKRMEINYPHVPFLLLQPPARLKPWALSSPLPGMRSATCPARGTAWPRGWSRWGTTSRN